MNRSHCVLFMIMGGTRLHILMSTIAVFLLSYKYTSLKDSLTRKVLIRLVFELMKMVILAQILGLGTLQVKQKNSVSIWPADMVYLHSPLFILAHSITPMVF